MGYIIKDRSRYCFYLPYFYLGNETIRRATTVFFLCLTIIITFTNFMQKAINTKLVALFALMAMAFAVAVPAYAFEELEIEIEIKESKSLVEVEYEEDGDDVEKEYEFETIDIEEVYALLATELGISKEEVKLVAEVENDDEEEDDSDASDATEAIDEATTLIAEAVDYIDTLEDDDKVETLTEYLATAEGYLADAQTAFEDEDYEEAEDKASMASDKVEDHILPDSDEDEDEDEDKDDKKETWTKEKCETNPGVGVGVKEKCDDDYKKTKPNQDKFKEYGKSTDRAELQAQMQELMQLLIQLLTMQLANQTS